MNKINLLYLVSTLKKSGPLKILFGIVSGLDRERFNILILSLSTEDSDSMQEAFESINCEIIQLKNSRLKGFFKNKDKVNSILKDRKIDLVHSHGLRADMINSSINSVEGMTTIHNFPDEDYPLKFGKVKGSIMAFQHRKAIAQIENRISCSHYVKEKFFNEYRLSTECIQNGVSMNSFSSKSIGSKERVRQNLSLPHEKRIFLVSGSLIKRKDPNTILKAFRLIKNDNALLLFIGSGILETELKRDYQDSAIKFVGNVGNVHDYLYASDYFISASSSEGLPNAVLEAFAADLPLILSNIPPHSEIVGENHPLLFKLHDPEDLAEKMNSILSDTWEQPLPGNKEYILKQFSADRMASQYQTKYMELCQLTEI